ncbi:hypothetical protein [[Ruminococcus] lactaris]|uniref:hypothetical protein n=1 Tax=[Ruminococcus] lactaris TaxID=46228 RepID=UPI00265F461C|nr:hypothetical protein [[Ruminococcus] lactaris]
MSEHYNREESEWMKQATRSRRLNYADMSKHPPDRKASADFHRPAYPNYTVEDALKKWGVDTRKGVDADGAETGRK